MTPFWILNPSTWLSTGFGFSIGRSERKNVSCFALVTLLFALTVTAEAQQPRKVTRIGYLSTTDVARDTARNETIRLALRELGYIEGQNIAFEYRYAEGRPDRYPE